MIDYLNLKSYLIVKKGIGDICATSYIGAIKRFIKATGITAPTEDDAIAYIMGFYENKKSYSHIVNTSLALERFSEYNGNPFRLGRPRKPKRIVKDTLSETEIARMFCFTRNIREKAILALLAYSGIRNLELCSLRVEDIDFTNNTVFIKAGKGYKDGIVCVPSACLEVVKEYLRVFPRRYNQPLFFSVAQNKRSDNLKTGAVRKHIKKIAKRAGIAKRVYPHLLRHSLAVNLLLKGCDIWTVKEELRHSDITTTLIYVNSSPKILSNRYQVFCPSYIWEAAVTPFILNRVH